MKVLTEQIVRFATGGTLAPEDLNRVYLQSKDSIDDVAQKRWARSTLTLPFRRACGAPLTQASAADELSWRFICPVECVLEGCELNANMTGTGAVQWALTTTGLFTPTGATVPYLSTDGTITDVTATTIDLNTDRVVLSAGVEYMLTVSGTAFSLARADVTLRIAVDRWKTSGTLDVPTFSPLMHVATAAPNAALVNANTSALTTQANKFAARRGLTPMLFTVTDLAAAAQEVFTFPLWEGTRTRATVVRIYAGAVFASAATGTVVASLRNAAGLPVGGASNAVSAATVAPLASGDSGALSLAVTGTGVTVLTTADFSLRIANTTGVTAKRAFALAWVEWS